jgi:hypothetical protein
MLQTDSSEQKKDNSSQSYEKVILSYPKRLNKLELCKPKNIQLIKDWLSIQLDLLIMKERDIKLGTGLHRGLDTILVDLCISKGIPYNVFLSCNDQDKFWDSRSRSIFKRLLSSAANVEFVRKESYDRQCIHKQKERIAEWASKDIGILFLIRNKYLSQNQVIIKNLFVEQNIRTFKI